MEETSEYLKMLNEIEELKPYLGKIKEVNEKKKLYKNNISRIIKTSIMGSILIYPVGVVLYKYKTSLFSLFYNGSDLSLRVESFGGKLKYMMIFWTLVVISLIVYGAYKYLLWNKESKENENIIDESNDFINSKEWFIPEGYRSIDAVNSFQCYLKEGRAFTKQECINLYIKEINHKEVIELLKEVRFS